MSKRSDMPTKYGILKFWASELIAKEKYWLDCFFDNPQHIKSEKERITSICFACGTTDTITERAHIIPICKGGDNNVKNLHLLCRECHLESELSSELGINYHDWFSFKSPQNSGSLLKRRNIFNIITNGK